MPGGEISHANPTMTVPSETVAPIVQPEIANSFEMRVTVNCIGLSRWRRRHNQSSKRHADESQHHSRNDHPDHH
jgi:hypothetical protein